MTYADLVKMAKENGTWNEKTMWCAVESISELLEKWKEDDPKAFWAFMREQHGIMSGDHYDEKFAMHDVAQIEYTDKKGDTHKGAYWTVEQIEEATKGMTFKSGVTKWDKFVAFNSFWADTCKALDAEQIIKAAYQFYFADEDFKGKNKVWEYQTMVHQA